MNFEFRTGNTPTWKWQYWIPHIVFPQYPNNRRFGCLGFWAFGWKLEVSWNSSPPNGSERT